MTSISNINQERKLIQVNTAGSVDNGKSTFIGRLLYDSGGLSKDVIAKIQRASITKDPAKQDLNLAFFTDGLKAEQARGITIDVARHYVSRDKLDLIIADTPGHQEFTRNMITGTSDSHVTLILVDATKGIVEQNRRHAYIAALLGVDQICVLINKMDLVDFSEARFLELKNEFDELISQLNAKQPNYIPISALQGDNVVESSRSMNWFTGLPVLSYLEQLDCADQLSHKNFRFVVQWIDSIKSEQPETTEIVGQLAAGSLLVGEPIKKQSSPQTTTIEKISGLDGEINQLRFPQQARLQLAQDLNLARGDVLSAPNTAPKVSNQIEAEICWMQETAFNPRNNLILQVGTKLTDTIAIQIQSAIDIENYHETAASKELQLNAIARVKITTKDACAWDEFKQNKALGRFILIDPVSKTTAAAGIVRSVI